MVRSNNQVHNLQTPLDITPKAFLASSSTLNSSTPPGGQEPPLPGGSPRPWGSETMSSPVPQSIDLKSKIRPELLNFPDVETALEKLQQLETEGAVIEILEPEEEDFAIFTKICDKIHELFGRIERIILDKKVTMIEGQAFEEDLITRFVEIERSPEGFYISIVDKSILKCFNGDNNSWKKEIARHHDTILTCNSNFRLITEWWLEIDPEEEENCVKAIVATELRYSEKSFKILKDLLTIANDVHYYAWEKIDSLQL